MSFTKEALQLVNDNALIAAGKTLPTFTPTAVIPEGAKVLDLEKFQEGRSRFRGVFSTHSLADYSAYVVGRAVANARGFIDQDGMSCNLLFNLGDASEPGHADDRAVLKLKATAGYSAAQEIAKERLTQKDLSDWIEDWHQYLTPVDEENNPIPVAKCIAAVRTITIKATSESETTVSDTGGRRSAMDQIEAQSKETLPHALLFNVTPFDGLVEQQIRLRVLVITSGSQPVLKLRWIGEEVQRESIAQEFKAVLEEKIGAAAKLSLGAFDTK
jgi:uncharacterized protein YfdQ (DUF2303 family)